MPKIPLPKNRTFARMNNPDFNRLIPLIHQVKKVTIIPHKNPDGDAIGSTLATQLYLKKKGVESVVLAPNQFPKFLKWLPGADQVFIAEYQKDIAQQFIDHTDALFLLDFNTLRRIDMLGEMVQNSNAPKVLIDHHEQPDTFDYMFSFPVLPATCQIVYHWIESVGDTHLIDTEIAECLYTGLLTDTGNFRFPSTNKDTFRIAGDLLAKGLDLQKIHTKLFDVNSENKIKLLSKTLDSMQVFPELRTSILALDKEDLLAHDFQKGDTEGFVNYGLSVENTVFSVILIYDLQHDFVKMSFRSKGAFDVNQFARKHFNGGGHVNAAGGRSQESVQATKEKLLQILAGYQEEINQIKI